MDVKVDDSWKDFMDRAIAQGRFESPDAVVTEGLRLVAARDAKLGALKELLEDAAGQDEVSEEQIDAAIEARAAELRRMGFAD